MNAHDRLRLYLEQRRELGETELVLDALPVDAVLKMIGAPPAKESTARNAHQTPPPSAGAGSSQSTPQNTSEGATSDAERSVNAHETQESAAAASPASPGGVAPSDPPPRFDNTVSTDWRATLSGLKPGGAQRPADRAGPDAARPDAARPDGARAGGAGAESSAASTSSTSSTPSTPSKTGDDAKSKSAYASNDANSAHGNAISVSASDFPSWLVNLGLPFGLTASPPSDGPTTPVANAASSIDELAAVIGSCRACALGALATNPVPGEGNINADFVCVGEAPGQSEDETGRPFVGAAGQLLTKILAAIQLQREDVFICNVLKHRPPGNRNPAPNEIHACTPYLTRQLSLVQPKVILALGTFAAQTLLNTTTPLGKLRGQVHRYQGVPLIVTYHPSALLRNEAWKRPAWDDVKLARRILDAARLNDSASQAS